MFFVRFAHPLNTGASLSTTVTVNEQFADPHAFVAVQVTVVVPLLKVDPLAGTQVIVTGAVPLVAVGGVKVTVVEQSPVPSALVLAVILAGQAESVGAEQAAVTSSVPVALRDAG